MEKLVLKFSSDWTTVDCFLFSFPWDSTRKSRDEIQRGYEACYDLLESIHESGGGERIRFPRVDGTTFTPGGNEPLCTANELCTILNHPFRQFKELPYSKCGEYGTFLDRFQEFANRRLKKFLSEIRGRKATAPSRPKPPKDKDDAPPQGGKSIEDAEMASFFGGLQPHGPERVAVTKVVSQTAWQVTMGSMASQCGEGVGQYIAGWDKRDDPNNSNHEVDQETVLRALTGRPPGTVFQMAIGKETESVHAIRIMLVVSPAADPAGRRAKTDIVAMYWSQGLSHAQTRNANQFRCYKRDGTTSKTFSFTSGQKFGYEGEP